MLGTTGTVYTEHAQLKTLSIITESRAILTLLLGWMLGFAQTEQSQSYGTADPLVVVECQPGIVISYCSKVSFIE